MESKMRILCGEWLEVAVYDGMCRLRAMSTVCGFSSETDESMRQMLREHNIVAKATVYFDGSVDVTRQKLVPWDISEDDIEQMTAEMDNELEAALGLAVGESVSSGGWFLGYDDDSDDDIMTDTEQKIINNN